MHKRIVVLLHRQLMLLKWIYFRLVKNKARTVATPMKDDE